MTLIKDKSGPVMGFRALAILTALLLILQPVLIGQYLARPQHDTWKDVHATVGDILILVTLIQLVLAFFARRTFGIGMVFHCLALLVLVFIQSMLGHAASDGHPTPKGIHVPLGVLLFGMGIFIPFLAFYDLRSQRRLDTPVEKR